LDGLQEEPPIVTDDNPIAIMPECVLVVGSAPPGGFTRYEGKISEAKEVMESEEIKSNHNTFEDYVTKMHNQFRMREEDDLVIFARSK
jgi:hypothetical protein